MDVMHKKHESLKQYLRELGSVAVAFSGGVDSTFLLKTAHDVLGERVIAITASSRSFPMREFNEAKEFCLMEGIPHVVCVTNELSIEGFSMNPPNRCYLCKKELLTKMLDAAGQRGIPNLAEGSNMDDEGDYRPGMTAVAELGVKSPLRQAGLFKEEIRALSKEAGLAVWNKFPFACLLSRFPYGQKITPEALDMIDRAEQILLDLGLKQERVRCHGGIARIETDEDGFKILSERKTREDLYEQFRQIGFDYVSLDLLGYRTGSMNETLKPAVPNEKKGLI